MGVATTDVPVVVFKPAEGDHEYVFAPPAVNVRDCEAQAIVAVVGDTVVVGKGFTVIETLAAALHVVTGSVTVQVYVTPTVGLATTSDPVEGLKLAEGVHE